ncbi:MAG: type II toxin-antitoxin system Phd/YefM family antitoxin [Coriobacteriia bacterium]|nr:type II toxin-antitoxin system Phd/YefM family antitoxin [Coriobacteriia bacterium]
MVFMTTRELRTNTKELWETLDSQQEIVLTNNGKPRAVVIPTDPEDLEETLLRIRSARAKAAWYSIRAQSEANGTGNLSMDEIDAIIAESRAERRAQQSA